MQLLVNAVTDLLPTGVVKSISALQWRMPWLRKAYLSVARSYTNRDGVVRRGPAKGLRFNAGLARNAGYLLGTYEPDVQELYASLVEPGMTVYDIGANVGFLAMLAARLTGPTGHVVCFEPFPANAESIRHNAVLNSFSHVTVITEAVGREDGTAEFQVSGDVGWGHLLGIGTPPGEPNGTIPVRVTRLSTAVSNHRLAQPDVIKIDIEGGEIGLLEGSREFLKYSRPIFLIELHGTNEGVAQILEEAGYSLYVAGGDIPIRSANPGAFVVAVPSEDTKKCAFAKSVAQQAALVG